MNEQVKETGIVRFEGPSGAVSFSVGKNQDTLWATRQQIAEAFGCSEDNVRKHVLNIYSDKELDESATSEKSSEVQSEGGREVRRKIDIYNLDVILSVGYRVNSQRATKFRQWATGTLKALLLDGFVLNEKRLAEDPEAQRQLAAKLREIRTDERNMYAKVRDVFATSAVDYNGNSQLAKTFFAMAQDKFHYAITGKTAAELILERANASKANMGLRCVKGEAPTAEEVKVGKNYLTETELRGLENICEQFMLFAESKAFRGHKMTMEELATKLNILLAANDYPVLYEYKSYLKAKADSFARIELDRYRARLVAGKKTSQISPPKQK